MRHCNEFGKIEFIRYERRFAKIQLLGGLLDLGKPLGARTYTRLDRLPTPKLKTYGNK